MSNTERQRQLQQDFFQKLRQLVKSEDYKNYPDTPEGVERFMFEHLGEEVKVLQREHPALFQHFFTAYAFWKQQHTQ